jgi:hypothetical protein
MLPQGDLDWTGGFPWYFIGAVSLPERTKRSDDLVEFGGNSRGVLKEIRSGIRISAEMALFAGGDSAVRGKVVARVG